MTAAERMLDEIISRQIVALRIRAGLARQQSRYFDRELARPLVAEILARLPNVPDLGDDTNPDNSKRLAALFDKLDGMASDAFSAMRATAQGALLQVARAEASWAAAALTRSVPIKISLKSATPDYLRSIVRSRPFQGQHLKAWYTELETQTKARVRKEVQLGLQQGQSTPDIARRLTGTKAAGFKDGALAISRRHAETVVSTAASHVSNAARQATYEANSSLIKGYRFVATLDSATTKICASLDGTVYPLGDATPKPPMHANCRSTTVPVLKSWREMGIDIDELPPGTRASMDGQVPANLTFEAWIKTKGEKFQRDWFGPARYELWKSGVKLQDMIGPGLKPLPLSALTAD